MNFDLLKRLRRLEAKANQAQAEKTVFILEDGSRFLADDDPVSYLIQHGPETPRGRIVKCEYEESQNADPITRSLYECLDMLFRK